MAEKPKVNSVSIQFLGAASTVTGSKHLLKTPEGNYLIDCGLFQGIKELRRKNWETLPVSLNNISAVILTHAHLDHCGYIPILVKNGYKKYIFCTEPTRDLAEIILKDSAEIQEEDAERANREKFTKHKPAKPLYTTNDVKKSLDLFKELRDNFWHQLSANVKFRFLKNGHILGSCIIEFDCFGKKIIFSGDLGREYSDILAAPTTITKADYLVMESTYGDRLHSPLPTHKELAHIILKTIDRKGNIIIPSFAVGRAQELMLIINELKKTSQIPNVPVYLDSPMATDATDILFKHPQWHKLKTALCKHVCENIIFVKDFKQTLKINRGKKSKIVIAASGMMTGGRVLEYVKHNIENPRNTILLAGFQAAGTRGRALKDGAHEIKIHGNYYKVKAKIEEISSFSAHADQSEMIRWMKNIKKKPERTFLVHGEHSAQEAFRVKIQDTLGFAITIPLQNEEYLLFNV